jgi:hypothetical protein
MGLQLTYAAKIRPDKTPCELPWLGLAARLCAERMKLTEDILASWKKNLDDRGRSSQCLEESCEQWQLAVAQSSSGKAGRPGKYLPYLPN